MSKGPIEPLGSDHDPRLRLAHYWQYRRPSRWAIEGRLRPPTPSETICRIGGRPTRNSSDRNRKAYRWKAASAWLEHGLERAVREMLAPAIEVDHQTARRSDVAREVERVFDPASVLSSRLRYRSDAGVIMGGGGPGSALPAPPLNSGWRPLLPDGAHPASS